MRNFGNCKGCGKAISYDNVCMCTNCHNKYYGSIKEYLRMNRFATTDDVSKALKISPEIIEYYKKKSLISMASKEMLSRRQQMIKLAVKEATQPKKTETQTEGKTYKVVGKYHFLTPDRIKTKYR